MPIHDWTKVNAGIFHAFHIAWIGELQATLNAGLLPANYYALVEQIAGPMGPDVLTLESQSPSTNGTNGYTGHDSSGGGLALTTAPPKVRWSVRGEVDEYALKRRTIVIRHSSDDRIVALIEIVSPGNKSSKQALEAFLAKVGDSFAHGYHLLIVDLFPPGPRDPNGIHGAIWSEFVDDSYRHPADEPLTLVAYSAGTTKTAYIEPTAVGKELIPMPLFLEPDGYIEVPLEETYQRAYRGVPRRWKRVIEGTPS